MVLILIIIIFMISIIMMMPIARLLDSSLLAPRAPRRRLASKNRNPEQSTIDCEPPPSELGPNEAPRKPPRQAACGVPAKSYHMLYYNSTMSYIIHIYIYICMNIIRCYPILAASRSWTRTATPTPPGWTEGRRRPGARRESAGVIIVVIIIIIMITTISSFISSYPLSLSLLLLL